MENDKIICIIMVIIGCIFVNADIASNDTKSNSISNTDIQKLKMIDSVYTDYGISNCTIEHYSFSVSHIDKCRLFINDSTAIFLTQNLEQRSRNEYTKVKLNNHALTLIKSLLNDLYLTHNSAINDSILEKYRRFKYRTGMPYWYIKLTLNDRQIEDTIPILSHIEFKSVKNIFQPKFYDLIKVVLGIMTRIELETCNDNENENVRMRRLNKIKQEFGDLYEPYNDTDTNK